MKPLILCLFALLFSFSCFAQISAISGPALICAGGVLTPYTDATGGGIWSSSSSIVTIGSTTGVAVATLPGYDTIIYTVGSSSVIYPVTVNGISAPIIGTTSLCAGVTTTLSCVTGGVWSSSTPVVATVGSGSGAVTGVATGVTTISYTFFSGCLSTVMVTVEPSPTPIALGSSTICAGSSTTVNDFTPGGAWTISNPTVATESLGTSGTLITGISTGTTLISYALSTSGCATSTSLTVDATPSVFSVTGGGSYCSGGTGVAVGLSGSQAGVSYLLITGTITLGPPVAGTGSAINFGLETIPGIYTVDAANMTTTCSAYMLGSVTVSVNPLPTRYTLTGGGSYCAGGAGVPISLSGSSAGINYQLCGPSPIGSPVPGTGTAINFGSWYTPGTYTVIANNAITGCTDTMTGSVTVSVNPLPAAYTLAGGGTVCAGGSGPCITLSGSSAGVTYEFVSGSCPAVFIAGTGSPLSYCGVACGGTYTVVATYSTTGCMSTMPGSASILIFPRPNIYSVSSTVSGALCAGVTDSFFMSGSDVGVNYQVNFGGAPVGPSYAGTGIPMLLGGWATPGVYTITATNITTGCYDTMGTITITSATAITAYSVTGGGSYCAGGAGVPVGLSGSQTGVSYFLYNGSSVAAGPISGTGGALSFGLQTAGGTYTVIASTSAGCTASMTGVANVVVNALPNVYTVGGGGTYCTGSSGACVTLSNSDTGVSYQLYLGGVAFSTPLMGTGSSLSFCGLTVAGTYTIVATNAIGCTRTMAGAVSVSGASSPSTYTVTGGGSYCTGGTGVTIGLSGSQTGVSYQLYACGSATGLPVTGTGSAISFGLQTMPCSAYTVVGTNITTSCSTNMSGSVPVSVNPLPTAYTVTGGGSYCAGGTGVTIGLSGSDAGVNYQAFSATSPIGYYVAGTGSTLTFGPDTTPGVYAIIATNTSTGCTNTMTGSATVVITPTTASSVSISATPGITICPGATDTFTAIVSGGASSYQWYINGTAVAGASSSTFATNTLRTPDSVLVIITSSAPCAVPTTASAGVTITVDVPTVTATASSPACNGAVTLSGGGAAGYSWSPGTGLSCSTCSTTTVTPTGTVTYTVTGTDALGCTATDTLTVDGNNISGQIIYSGGSLSDTFTVWLIQFNPSDSFITALDSTSTCMSAGVPYFEFMDPAAGNYMVKAKLNSAIAGTSGYIPTYCTSTPYWYAAATDSHAAAADVMNITMLYGTVPAGPGFISGYVVSGAGRGTSGIIPDAGLQIYLEDGTGHVLAYTYTDDSGKYSFNNLQYGNYIIYPEDFTYYTTPSAVINLNSSSDSVSAINFIQHTTSKTITPNTTLIPVVVNNAQQGYYPNPTNGILNIGLGTHAAGTSDVVITNVTGSVVYRNALNISSSQSQVQLDLTALNDGMYFISFKSDDINFVGKLLIVK